MGGNDPSSEVKGSGKGPEWAIYRHIFPGRKICMNNRRGVVIGLSKSMLVPFGIEELGDYWVQFLDVEDGVHELVSSKDVKANALEEFDEGPYTRVEIRELQKRNWEPDTDSESENSIEDDENEDEENEAWDGEPVVKLNTDEFYMHGPDGYIYNKAQAYTDGDDLIENWYFTKFDPDTEWEVERIVRHRRDEKGQLEYLLKYKGFELNPGNLQFEGDWQSQSGIQDCLHIVDEYLDGLAASEKPLCLY